MCTWEVFFSCMMGLEEMKTCIVRNKNHLKIIYIRIPHKDDELCYSISRGFIIFVPDKRNYVLAKCHASNCQRSTDKETKNIRARYHG